MAITVGSWSFAALLIAAEYTPQADHAPRLVRGLAWSIACAALLLGLATLAARATAALIDAIVRTGAGAQRNADAALQTLRAESAARLDSHHAALRAVAQQAAAATEPAARAELRLLGSVRQRQRRSTAN